MAGALLKYGHDYNTPVAEFAVKQESDLQDLPTSTTPGKGIFKGINAVPIGSVCSFGDTTAGYVRTFMLFDTWMEI